MAYTAVLIAILQLVSITILLSKAYIFTLLPILIGCATVSVSGYRWTSTISLVSELRGLILAFLRRDPKFVRVAQPAFVVPQHGKKLAKLNLSGCLAAIQADRQSLLVDCDEA